MKESNIIVITDQGKWEICKIAKKKFVKDYNLTDDVCLEFFIDQEMGLAQLSFDYGYANKETKEKIKQKGYEYNIKYCQELEKFAIKEYARQKDINLDGYYLRMICADTDQPMSNIYLFKEEEMKYH